MAAVREVRVFESADVLAAEAAEEIVGLGAAVQQEHGRTFSIALAGGATPKACYQLLATPQRAGRLDWDRVDVFWGDERCVPPDHEDSNYRMAYEALLSKVPVPPARVHRMRGESVDADRAAADYELELYRVLPASATGHPRIDVVLLGLGADGHTASLFPQTAALAEAARSVVANRVPQIDATRLTLTLPVICGASTVIFLVAGTDKAPVVHEVLHGPYRPADLPAQQVDRMGGRVLWLLDSTAANPG